MARGGGTENLISGGYTHKVGLREGKKYALNLALKVIIHLFLTALCQVRS